MRYTGVGLPTDHADPERRVTNGPCGPRGALPTDHVDPEGRYQRTMWNPEGCYQPTMWTQRDRGLVDTYVLITKVLNSRVLTSDGGRVSAPRGKNTILEGKSADGWGVRPAARKGRLEFTTRGGGGGIQPLEFKSTGVWGVRPAAQPPSDRVVSEVVPCVSRKYHK